MYKNISIASDHNGYDLKNTLIKYLNSTEYNVVDLGPINKNTADYSDYAKLVCENILDNYSNIGILICGTGIGMSMAANRYSDITAALCMTPNMAKFARAHYNANILVMGARISEDKSALEILNIFLNEKFDGGRHLLRLDKF